MTPSVVQLAWAVLGAVFGAGAVYARMQGNINKAESDINNVGGISRANEKKAERRWKHQIATAIETSGTLEEAKTHAKLLREDAWRD